MEGVDFEIPPRATVAFVGSSGSAKSTIFSLLERFYSLRSGEILIGDNNIIDISLKDWRRQSGFVSQENAFLTGTIDENLVYGLESNITEKQCFDALHQAYALDFVRRLPKGLYSEIGERGVNLSGGEKQRIAIARAFL